MNTLSQTMKEEFAFRLDAMRGLDLSFRDHISDLKPSL